MGTYAKLTAEAAKKTEQQVFGLMLEHIAKAPVHVNPSRWKWMSIAEAAVTKAERATVLRPSMVDEEHRVLNGESTGRAMIVFMINKVTSSTSAY